MGVVVALFTAIHSRRGKMVWHVWRGGMHGGLVMVFFESAGRVAIMDVATWVYVLYAAVEIIYYVFFSPYCLG